MSVLKTAWRRTCGYFPTIFEPKPWGRKAYLFLAACLAPMAYALSGPLHKAYLRGWPDLGVGLVLSAILMLGSVVMFAVLRWFMVKIFMAPRPGAWKAMPRKRRSKRSRRRKR